MVGCQTSTLAPSVGGGGGSYCAGVLSAGGAGTGADLACSPDASCILHWLCIWRACDWNSDDGPVRLDSSDLAIGRSLYSGVSTKLYCSGSAAFIRPTGWAMDRGTNTSRGPFCHTTGAKLGRQLAEIMAASVGAFVAATPLVAFHMCLPLYRS